MLITESEFIGINHQAKVTAVSNAVEDRLYALIKMLHKKLRRRNPGAIPDSNLPLLKAYQFEITELFNNQFQREPDFEIWGTITKKLLN